jgi:hypothetical protein
MNPERSPDDEVHNENLHNVYCHPSFVMVIKSREFNWQDMLPALQRSELGTKFWL